MAAGPNWPGNKTQPCGGTEASHPLWGRGGWAGLWKGWLPRSARWKEVSEKQWKVLLEPPGSGSPVCGVVPTPGRSVMGLGQCEQRSTR